MKRAPFLGAGAAVVLTACGGNHVMRALPGVAPASNARTPLSSAADPIPESVLRSPILGEVRRFDGTMAPPLWMLTQGQTLKIAENPVLYRVLGTVAGGDGKMTFRLPNPKIGFIIAVGGTLATSPNVFKTLGRHMTLQDSLGEGARPAVGPVVSERVRAERERRDAVVRSERSAITSAIRTKPSAYVPISPQLESRYDAARASARSVALAALSAGNRSRAASLLSAAAAGSITLDGATREMAAALDAGEASALLHVHDDEVRQFRPGWAGMDHPDPRFEAARYLFDVALDDDQRRAVSTMRQNG